MLQPWEQDKLTYLTRQEIGTDYEELKDKVYAFTVAFTDKTRHSTACKKYIRRKILEKRKESSPTLLEEVLELQKIIEMYMNYIGVYDPIKNLIDKFWKLSSDIDDVRVALQKLYKKFEEQYAIKLIEKGG